MTGLWCNLLIDASRRMPSKAHLLDNLSRCGVCSTVIVYFIALLIAAGVGIAGPRTTAKLLDVQPYIVCPGGPSCTGVFTATLTDLRPYNQFLIAYGQVSRPTLPNGQLAMGSVALSYSQRFELDVAAFDEEGNAVELLKNGTHAADVRCEPNSVQCNEFLLLWEPQITASRYEIRIRWLDVLAPFASGEMPAGITISTAVYTVPVAYTSFALGWRYFFITSAVLGFLAYIVALWRGPGRTDANGNRLRTTLEQKWVAWLAFCLIFFNDPSFAHAIFNPTFPGSVLSALGTVTFVCSLLMYLLLHAHLAALQGEGGITWELDSSNRTSLGVLFWAPKIIFFTAFWILTLSAYLWTRYQQISDPAYSLFEATSQFAIGRYFYAFIYAIISIYGLYYATLIVLACRNWTRMRASNKTFTIVSITTIILVAVGVYADVFSPLRTASAAFLLVFGACNFFVWLAMFATLPDRKTGLAELVDEESGGVPPDTTGAMGARASAGAAGSVVIDDAEDGEFDLEVRAEDLAATAGAATRKPASAAPAGKARSAAAAPPAAAGTGGRRPAGKAAAPAPAAAAAAVQDEDDDDAIDFEAQGGSAPAGGAASGPSGGVFVVEEDDDDDGGDMGSGAATGAAAAPAAAAVVPGARAARAAASKRD